MVDYIEEIKSIEIKFKKTEKGVQAFVYHLDKDKSVLKESEYNKDHYSANVAEAYQEVLNKMNTVLTGTF